MAKYNYTGEVSEEPDNVFGYTGKIYIDKTFAEKLPKRADGSRRYIITIPQLDPWSASLLPSGKGDFYLILNKARFKSYVKQNGNLDKVPITLTLDDSKYGMPIPLELEELLYQDPEGQSYFEALSPGKQRSLIFLVSKPKREATRLQKAVQIIEYLKWSMGKLDFKELNAYFKEHKF